MILIMAIKIITIIIITQVVLLALLLLLLFLLFRQQQQSSNSQQPQPAPLLKCLNTRRWNMITILMRIEYP